MLQKVNISVEKQNARIFEAESRCQALMANDSEIEGRCKRAWDRITCWPPTLAGQKAEQPCPSYVQNFLLKEVASRECLENGTWYTKNGHEYTDYTSCLVHEVSQLMQDHFPRLMLMGNIGYGVSLASLAAAVVIMLYFKKLHCQRNTLHLNLFVTFILKAVIGFAKDMSEGIGIEKNMSPDGECKYTWTCKLLYTAYMYIISANYTWIFVEGLYLHMLIFMAFFSENKGIVRYLVLGWVTPLVFIIPWIIVRVSLDDYACWNLYKNKDYFWIIRAPIVLTILVNFIFFLNIVRVLFTKMQESSGAHADRANRYRKLAKSTLVLIPLFGIHYIVFIWIDESFASDTVQLAWLYFEMFFNSFQGLFIALLFCFMNGEVQAEFKKKWQRYKLRTDASFSMHTRDRSYLNTSTTYVCRDDRHLTSDYKVFTQESAPSNLIQNKVASSNGCRSKWRESSLEKIDETSSLAPDK